MTEKLTGFRCERCNSWSAVVGTSGASGSGGTASAPVSTCVLFRLQDGINILVSLGCVRCHSLANLKASLGSRELGLDLRSSCLIIPFGATLIRLVVFGSER